MKSALSDKPFHNEAAAYGQTGPFGQILASTKARLDDTFTGMVRPKGENTQDFQDRKR